MPLTVLRGFPQSSVGKRICLQRRRPRFDSWIRKVLWRSHLIVSGSVRPHGLQPTRLLSPWDSPGRNTGGGRHFLLQESDTTYQRSLHHHCSKYIARVSDLLGNLSSFHRKAGGEQTWNALSRVTQLVGGGVEDAARGSECRAPLASRVLGRQSKSGGSAGAATGEAAGDTGRPRWFQEEFCWALRTERGP